jgi:hypothetical protein
MLVFYWTNTIKMLNSYALFLVKLFYTGHKVQIGENFILFCVCHSEQSLVNRLPPVSFEFGIFGGTRLFITRTRPFITRTRPFITRTRPFITRTRPFITRTRPSTSRPLFSPQPPPPPQRLNPPLSISASLFLLLYIYLLNKKNSLQNFVVFLGKNSLMPFNKYIYLI